MQGFTGAGTGNVKYPLTLVSRRPRTPAFVFEPVRPGGQDRLLVLSPGVLRARLRLHEHHHDALCFSIVQGWTPPAR